MIAAIVIVVLLMLTVVGVMCIKAVSIGKQPIRPMNDGGLQENPVRSGGSYSSLGDTKEFIPVTNLDDYAFCIGDFNYRAIVECSAVNFGLMNSMEQDRVEASYSQYLNSLSFPILNYMQTREFDKDTMIDNIHANINRAVKKYPMVADYGNAYAEQISYLMGGYIQNTKIKKNFVIISYGIGDMTDVSALSADEVKEFALQELSTRAMIVKNGLESVGIPCEILDKKGIVEVLYAYYHRDYYKIMRDFASGLFNSILVTKKDNQNYFDKEILDRILAESQDKVMRLAGPGSTKEEIAFYEYVYQTLDSLRAIPTNNYEYYKSIVYPHEQENQYSQILQGSESVSQDAAPEQMSSDVKDYPNSTMVDYDAEKTEQMSHQQLNYETVYQAMSYEDVSISNEKGGV